QPRMIRVLLEPLRDVPADRIDLPVAATLEVGDGACDHACSVAVAAESRDRECSRKRDRRAVVTVIENADEHSVPRERVTRSILLISEEEAVDHSGIRHESTLGHLVTSGLALTRGDFVRHNPPMTTNARPLSAQEANRTTGMMMPGRVGMCCRMCR